MNKSLPTIQTARGNAQRNSTYQSSAKRSDLDNYSTEESDEAYRLTVHPRPRNKFRARGLEEQVEELALMQPRKLEDLPPLFEFAVRLEKYSPKLIDFVKSELEQAELPLSQLVSLRNSIEREQQCGLSKLGTVRHILFDLGSDQIECWDFLGDQFEDHRWLEESKDSPAAQVSKHLNLLESKGEVEETLFLEFFVRFDDEEDDEHDFDQWEHDIAPLGSCYPVAVRWRDRTLGHGLVKQKFWREKTQAIKARASLDQAPTVETQIESLLSAYASNERDAVNHLLKLAEDFASAGKVDDALLVYQKIIERFPMLPDGWNALAKFHLQPEGAVPAASLLRAGLSLSSEAAEAGCATLLRGGSYNDNGRNCRSANRF